LRKSRVSIDEQHVAMPKLYGAPAYARPPTPAETVPRPFDPDELPIEADLTDDEREFKAALPPRAFAPGGVTLAESAPSQSTTSTGLRPRAFSLRGIAGKIVPR
jgi:hypothetical protein